MIDSASYPETRDVKEEAATVRSVSDYRAMLDDFRNSVAENARQQDIDEDYYHGKQLTVAEKRILSGRGQPDIVINRVRTAVNGILGVMIQAKADPRALPRTPDDDNSSDVATDVLRYVTYKNRWNQVKSRCFYSMLVPGIGACLVKVTKDKEVIIDQIRREEFFYDPRSRREDFRDAQYMGIAKWMYAADVRQMYPDKDIDSDYNAENGLSSTGADLMFQDRPINEGSLTGNAWLDKQRKRVLVCEVYHKYKGKWYRCVFYAGGVLEEGDSPYQDDKGNPCCPIEAMTGYIDSDNCRYGIVRDMRDIQDEINKRRSKLLHVVNSHQVQATDPSAIDVDTDIVRKEAARPDGVLPIGWQIVRTTDMASGQMQLLGESKGEMERMGPNPAVLGRQGSDTSGRALLARQQAGLVELALVIDALDDWEWRVFHQIWWRVKQYWRDPQYIRVSDHPDDVKFLQINKPRGPEIGQHPETGEMMRGPPQYDDNKESVFGYDNDVAEMDVDIIVDTQPETANIMQEMVADLIKLVAASPTYAEQIPFEMFVELSPLPRKRQILDMIKQSKEQQAQQKAQIEAIQTQGAIAKLKAEIDEIKAKTFNLISTGQAALIKAGGESQPGQQATDDSGAVLAEAFESESQRLHQAQQAEQQRQHDAQQAELDRQHEVGMESARQAHEASQAEQDRQAAAQEASQPPAE
jgi:hypothetical protein